MMRLDRFLSEAGVATRRELKQIIKAGRVTVDGTPVTAPETKVDEAAACVALDGAQAARPGRIVVLLHKPAGYVTSTKDPRDRTVLELLPPAYQGLFPVGRLDKETEGLLLLTNDGVLGHRLTAPKHRVEKEYYARTEGQVTAEDVSAFAAGLTLRDGTVCRPAVLTPIPSGCRVTVTEGKYHQVRRMLAAVGKPVTYLRREREGKLTLDGTEKGKYRELRRDEVEELLSDFTDSI